MKVARRLSAWILAVASVVPFSLHAARGQGLNMRGQGLGAGRFTLYPSLTIEFTRDDNVLYRSVELPDTDRVRSGLYLVRPRIVVDLPLGENRIRWAYAAAYRDYTTDAFVQSERFGHFLDLEGGFRIGPTLTFSLKDRLVRGTLEVQEVDQGGELTFGLSPFVVHEPELNLTLDMGARHGVSLIPRYSSVRFDAPDEAVFFNYQRRELEGRYNYKVGPAATLYAFYNFGDTDQNRQEIFFGDTSLTIRSAGVGLNRSINQAVVTQISAGYQAMEFQGGSESNYHGPIVDAATILHLSDISRLEIIARRQAYQSFYVNNSHYVGNQVRLRLTQQFGRSAYWQAAIGYQSNAYADAISILVTPETDPGHDQDMDGRIDAFESLQPSVGVRRRDRSLDVEVGAGWQLLRTLQLFIGYNSTRRRSNIEQNISGELVDPFHYGVGKLLFRVEVGWL